MQIIFIFIILILYQKILTEENDISIEINETKNIFFENKIYELNDTVVFYEDCCYVNITQTNITEKIKMWR